MVRFLIVFAINLAVVAASIFFSMRYGGWVLLPAAVAIGCVAALTPRRESLWQQRASRGLCTKCGYDLRASIIRCPECGHSMED